MILSDFNTDSLYKFLTTFGIIMVIFSVMHPLEKKNEIELKNNEYKKELSIHQIDAAQLNDSAIILNNSIIKAQAAFDKMIKNNNIDSLKVKTQRKTIKVMYSSFHSKKLELEKKECVLLYKKKEIEILDEQINKFQWISILLLIFGPLFIIYGFISWRQVEKNNDGITKIKIM